MKNKIRKVLALIILMILILSIPGSVQANVQSVKNSSSGKTSKNAMDFFIAIRQMESNTGPMGLNAIIDNLTGDESSISNNIDTHMIKSTEYGAMIMLMDSDYGSKVVIGGDFSSTTSTGNATGIYEVVSSKCEFVAGTIGNSQRSKYINRYESRSSVNNGEYKIGDATWEIKDNWLGYSYESAWLGRSIFSATNSNNYLAFSSRVSVVCGLRILIKFLNIKKMIIKIRSIFKK